MVIFTHVPKTSGTSMRKSLVEPNVGAAAIYGYRGMRAFLRDGRPRKPFVWGHMPYGIHLLNGGEARYITFLRDPVDRAVSYYYFVKDSDPTQYRHPARVDAEAHSIVDFYALPRYQNWQARYIAGFDYHYAYPRAHGRRFDRALLRRASRNLTGRYACFGLQDRFEESLDLFGRRLGWERREAVAPQKKTATRPALDGIDAATRAALRERNRLDCELYELAQASFGGGDAGQ